MRQNEIISKFTSCCTRHSSLAIKCATSPIEPQITIDTPVESLLDTFAWYPQLVSPWSLSLNLIRSVGAKSACETRIQNESNTRSEPDQTPDVFAVERQEKPLEPRRPQNRVCGPASSLVNRLYSLRIWNLRVSGVTV